jgi:putative hydrolase of the HAD superfamily
MANHNLYRIKAIVFDLDDTLYPQIEFKRSGFNAVSDWLARKFDLDRQAVLSVLETILDQYGPSYPFMFDRLVERMALHKSALPHLVEVFIRHDPSLECFPGVIAMLERLRKTYRLGILTDGRNCVQRRKIIALNLEKLVDEILCSDEIGLEKPAEELFAWFEYKFGIACDQMMYIGDDCRKDFYGANLRRWTTVAVETGEVSAESANAACKAQYEIIAVTDLEKLLAEIPCKIEKNDL